MAAPIYKGGSPFFKPGIRTAARVIASGATAVTIKPGQSGSVFLFDGASITYTLPTPRVGLEYTFYTTVTSATTAIVVTNAATVFITGTIVMGVEATTPGANPGPDFFSGNGTSHIKVTQNGTTTGGLIGSAFSLTCVSTTKWFATGLLLALAGQIIATPFSV